MSKWNRRKILIEEENDNEEIIKYWRKWWRKY